MRLKTILGPLESVQLMSFVLAGVRRLSLFSDNGIELIFPEHMRFESLSFHPLTDSGQDGDQRQANDQQDEE